MQKCNEEPGHLSSSLLLRLKYVLKLLDEDGLNIAGTRELFAMIPCRAITNCSEDDNGECGAYNNSSFPCWAASEKGSKCKNSDCRECEVYRVVENYPGVKSFLKSLMP